MTCFICRETGAKCCDGHCGLCADQEQGVTFGDGHPSARDHGEDCDE